MSKRIFIVHQWGASPKADWYPWLKEVLEKKGLQVIVPAMPNPDVPEIAAWVKALGQVVQQPDRETFFVGHSVGCQTIFRYLQSLEDAQTVGGVVCVAGWLTLQNLSPEEQEAANPWLNTPLEFESIKQKAPKIVALFSANDPVVPAANRTLFEQKLGAKTVLLPERGHFSADDGVTELPEALDAITTFLS